jgi:hypothetical protein
MTHQDTVDHLLRLRVAVGGLGQAGSHGWWPCSYLDPTGLDTLAYNFPRAPRAAGFAATSLAAKKLHDDRIGQTGVTHLFRLEPDLEIQVQRAATEDRLAAIDLDPAALMRDLVRMADHEIDTPEGPVQVGFTADVDSPEALASMARHYQAGFRLGIRVFPYLASRRA